MERRSTGSPQKKTAWCDMMQNDSWGGDDEQGTSTYFFTLENY